MPRLQTLKPRANVADPRRPEVAQRGGATERGYNYRWQRARVAFLRGNPLCRMCEDVGRFTPASVVDHVVPHRGDQALFWDAGNWQPLCKPCHDGEKRRIETTGGGSNL